LAQSLLDILLDFTKYEGGTVRFQQTIGSPVSCSGVGLHSGQPVTLTLRPAPPNTGIVFIYRHGSEETLIPASISNKVPTELCTAISVKGHQVKTIEHLLAALVGMEVDNVYAEVNAGEVPVLDGSSSPFVRLIRAAGIIPQTRRQSYVKIMQPIEVVDGSNFAYPWAMAEAERAMALPSITSNTGAFNCLANSAVLPFSCTGELPSNNPIIPSMMETSASAEARVKMARFTSSPSIHPSRFREGLPVAAWWWPGSIKSGPALNG
jgi:hypothetical protein